MLVWMTMQWQWKSNIKSWSIKDDDELKRGRWHTCSQATYQFSIAVYKKMMFRWYKVSSCKLRIEIEAQSPQSRQDVWASNTSPGQKQFGCYTGNKSSIFTRFNAIINKLTPFFIWLPQIPCWMNDDASGKITIPQHFNDMNPGREHKQNDTLVLYLGYSKIIACKLNVVIAWFWLCESGGDMVDGWLEQRNTFIQWHLMKQKRYDYAYEG